MSDVLTTPTHTSHTYLDASPYFTHTHTHTHTHTQSEIRSEQKAPVQFRNVMHIGYE